MNISYFPASSRGKAATSWLQTFYSYSFAHYYNPDRMGFGPLRVINDDTIAPLNGFPMHSHTNMEIITIVFTGQLTHKDSLGNESTIDSGKIQVMSAGTGVTHSEYNLHPDKPVQLMQIWIAPNVLDITPQYNETSFESPANFLTTLVGPGGKNATLTIHQDAYIGLGNFEKDSTITYHKKHPKHGIKIMTVEGSLVIDSYTLEAKDSVEITDVQEVSLEIKAGTRFLIFDV